MTVVLERPNQYRWGRPYQVKLLALMVKRPRFIAARRDIFKPAYFADGVLADLCREILDYYDRHNKPPTLDALEEAVADLLESDPRRAEVAEAYAETLGDMASATLDEADDIAARAVAFARNMAIKLELENCVRLWEEGREAEMEGRIRQALRVGEDRVNLGTLYFDNTERYDRPRRGRAVGTGLRTLDRYLKGGLAKRELGIVEGPTGRFKTGMLVNLGTAALRQGYDVVHISLEMPEDEVGHRYDGCLLNANIESSIPDVLREKLAAKKQQLLTQLVIKHWPIGTATATMIRAYLHALVAEGIIDPEGRKLLIIVDYGQIMRPERTYGDKRHEHRDNYQSLIQIAEEFDCPVWSAMQSNRGSVNKRIIGIEDLAECFGVAADAHIILSLNQTKEERESCEMRIFIAKARSANSFEIVDVDVDYEMSRIAEVAGGRRPDTEEDEEPVFAASRRRVE